MGRFRSTTAIAVASALLAPACGSPTRPSPHTVDFVVAVKDEVFVLRTSDPETIRLAEENRQGRNQRFPSGPLRKGDGGFNAPWTWHLDPAATRFVELAIEVCDGEPSYIEVHQADFSTYCPWGAKVIGRR